MNLACFETLHPSLPERPNSFRGQPPLPPRSALRAPLEMHPVTRPCFVPVPVPVLALVAAVSLGGCSTVSDLLSGDKIDYRTNSSNKTAGLEVPPDLTQLKRDSRYQQVQSGSVSAAAYQAGTPAAAVGPAQPAVVAPQAVGDVKLERLGNERWLRTSLTAEQLWPQLQSFWKERGFVLVQDQSAAGVMETDWAENRGKIPLDFIRATVGKVFDSAYSTGELDKFRTRVERSAAGGSEIYISHRGMIEVYRGERKENTVWQPRLADPQLEGEFLARLMQKLGATEEVAKAAVVASGGSPTSVRARLVEGRPSPTLQVDDGFDRAWRRVGVALDRSGFTVEDRDRTQGLYFVRYVDPSFAGKEEPNFFSKLFSFGSKKSDGANLARYRVSVKAEGERSVVTVLNNKGEPETGEAGKRISTLLLEDLK